MPHGVKVEIILEILAQIQKIISESVLGIKKRKWGFYGEKCTWFF